MSDPWMKFYPTDWRSDPALRMCSMAARGLWIEMIALMHEATPYGHLLVSGRSPTDAQLAVLVGAPSDQVPEMIGELESAGVFSRTREGVIYSRKMTRTAKKAAVARKNGKNGGNPALSKDRENPPSVKGQDKGGDNTQKPEARSQKPESSSNAARLPDQTFRERLILAAGGHPSGINPATGRPTCMGGPADMLEVQQWLQNHGLTEAEIIQVIQDGAARKQGAPASTLRFFAGHVRDFAAVKAGGPAAKNGRLVNPALEIDQRRALRRKIMGA